MDVCFYGASRSTQVQTRLSCMHLKNRPSIRSKMQARTAYQGYYYLLRFKAMMQSFAQIKPISRGLISYSPPNMTVPPKA